MGGTGEMFAEYGVLFSIALVVFVNIILGFSVVKKSGEGYKSLAHSIFGAAILSASYLISIITDNYFIESLSSSIYFIGVAWTLYFLVDYMYVYTHAGKNSLRKFFKIFLIIGLSLDSIFFLINPFYEISVHYIALEGSLFPWRYEKSFLFGGHLALSYIMVAIILAVLVHKSLSTPSIYRNRYRLIEIGLLFAVGMNALFLYIPSSGGIDYGLFMYSALAAVVYWNQYYYSGRGILNETREAVLNSIGHPFILFDYENNYVTSNEKIARIVSTDLLQQDYTLTQFLADTGISDTLKDLDRESSFQCLSNVSNNNNTYRCDFHILHAKKNIIAGKLFVFTDITLDVDLLTGFHTLGSFTRTFGIEEHETAYPVSVMVCDINQLAQINELHGRKVGDNAIRSLAELMKKHFPEGTYFARLQDANLLALCSGLDIYQSRAILDTIQNDLNTCKELPVSLDMQSSACVLKSAGEGDIISASAIAIKGMRAKKMLDSSSAHASILDSLVQTLQEGDSDTKEHVARTCIMGEKLGRRLGLSDIDLSNLSLLCMLHDIGKVGVPLEILNKPIKLTSEEWAVMKSHVEKGYRIVTVSNELAGIANLVLHHHESWDGRGYPSGLKGDSIPLLCRIISVVDSFDAMTNDRPYRKAMSITAAIQELERCAGKQFDPYIVSEFVNMLKEIYPDEASLVHAEVPAKPSMFVATEPTEEELNSGMVATVTYTSYILDSNQTIISVSSNFEELTGYSEEDVKSYHLTQRDLIFSEDAKIYFDTVAKELAKYPEAYIEHRLRRKDGSARYVMCFGRVFYDPASRSQRTQVTLTDIANATSTQALLSQAQRRASHTMNMLADNMRKDPLTNLLNRTAFQNDIQIKLLNPNTNMVMLMMDLDHFKDYNDKNGHWKGDQLLIYLGRALEDSVKNVGIAGRMGGDEFAAAIFFKPEDSTNTIQETLDAIWNKVSNALLGYDKGLSISMGAAMSSQIPDCSFSGLYKKSDEALYHAKELGRNRLYTGF